ncbi:RNA polymerase sigma-B factor [Kribbella voronezhensis]|uniref:RNA polymerase sigma-B factor n=1 Tax=Kribbella voronezhensis TaxID=2512212 RepID=A0A4R7SWW7_9ACTN|nr:sigma-70 family RNA polymerase sigma factor [Kribbella voronezhensis]TDU83852.1 RNA polymerase sigma-B factor [Kribbella voronezhensis]
MAISDSVPQPSTSVRPPARPLRDQQATEVERLLRLAAGAPEYQKARLLEEAILAGLPMARTLAARYCRRGVDTEDVHQVACVGLVKAVRGYRPGDDTDFRSYALPTIRGEIRRYFRDRAWMVRPPRNIQDVQSAINAAEGELALLLRRWPTADDLATALDLPVAEILDAQRAQGCFHPTSLDANVVASPTLSLANTIADERDTYELVDDVEALRPVVADLPDRSRLILHRRFVEHRTQAEIGAEIGVSQMQVSRLLHEIMQLFRAALTA